MVLKAGGSVMLQANIWQNSTQTSTGIAHTIGKVILDFELDFSNESMSRLRL